MPKRPLTEKQLLFRVRVCLLIVIGGLVVSGVTAYPLETELRWGVEQLGLDPSASPEDHPPLQRWLLQVYQGLRETNQNYPFLAYGTDWLAFAHLVIAIAFIGPLRDPVKNIWVIQFGMIASVLVIPNTLICGTLRGLPFFHLLIDLSFVTALVPLYLAYRYTKLLHAQKA